MTAREEYCDAIIARNAFWRLTGCDGRYKSAVCSNCQHYADCEGRVKKARAAVRKECNCES